MVPAVVFLPLQALALVQRVFIFPTGDPKHLHRALKFAEFMTTPVFQERARTPDSPYSLYEGWAGTVCFFADLLAPQKAEFPLFNVFDG